MRMLAAEGSIQWQCEPSMLLNCVLIHQSCATIPDQHDKPSQCSLCLLQ